MADRETGGQEHDPSTDQVPLDAEAKRLQLQQIKAQARSAIAEADRARLQAALPKSTVTPPEGKVAVSEKSGFIAELAAYAVLDKAAEQIVDSLVDVKRVLIVEDHNLLASDWPYFVICDQLDRLTNILKDAEERLAGAGAKEHSQDGLASAAAVAIAVPALIGAGAQLVGMFRADYSTTGRQITINSSALIAAVINHMARKGSAIAVLEPFNLIDDGNALLLKFAKLRTDLIKVQARLMNLEENQLADPQNEIDNIAARLADAQKARLETSGNGKPADEIDELLAHLREQWVTLNARIAPLREVDREARAAVDAAVAFIESVTTVPSSGYPAIIAAAIRERLHGKDPAITHVLYVSPVAAGGETITKRTLWTRSGNIAFLGGAQVTHLILDVRTKNVTGGTNSWTAQVHYNLKDNKLEGLAIAPL